MDLKLYISELNLRSALSEVAKFVKPGKKYVITIKESEGRSLPANAMAHVWIKQISEYTGEDIKTTECRCKRDHGLPITLAGDNGTVTAWMLKQLKFYQLSDSQQLKVIAAMEVTRNFSTKEHKQYRDSIQQYWNAQGLDLQYL